MFLSRMEMGKRKRAVIHKATRLIAKSKTFLVIIRDFYGVSQASVTNNESVEKGKVRLDLRECVF